MSSKIPASLAAGALIVTAGLAFSAVSAPGVALAEHGEAVAPRVMRVLGRVLDELADEGTISGDDADAVLEAVESELAELNEQHSELGHLRRHLLRKGARFGALLDDGGISEGEYEMLDQGHPLKQVDIGDALDDGLISPRELRDIWREHKRG